MDVVNIVENQRYLINNLFIFFFVFLVQLRYSSFPKVTGTFLETRIAFHMYNFRCCFVKNNQKDFRAQTEAIFSVKR